jgi:hypothetical protein
MPPRIIGHEARWITPQAELVAQIVEQALGEEAWWTAARSGKYAARAVVWVDGPPAVRETAAEPPPEELHGEPSGDLTC